MEVLIIEDEAPASNRLISLLGKSHYPFKVTGVCTSVKTSLEWFKNNPMPKLLFADVQLSDGSSFDIFKETEITCPVIFTTAFDSYAIQAFKQNSIDYILKPFQVSDINSAIEKYEKTKLHCLRELSWSPSISTPQFKSRFFVKTKNNVYSISIDDISVFSYEHGGTALYDSDCSKYQVQYSLDQLEKLLDPNIFFRINRKQIVQLQHIISIKMVFKNRLELGVISTIFQEELIVSKHRVSKFKTWLDGSL